jgi:hypothetical protein
MNTFISLRGLSLEMHTHKKSVGSTHGRCGDCLAELEQTPLGSVVKRILHHHSIWPHAGSTLQPIQLVLVEILLFHVKSATLCSRNILPSALLITVDIVLGVVIIVQLTPSSYYCCCCQHYGCYPNLFSSSTSTAVIISSATITSKPRAAITVVMTMYYVQQWSYQCTMYYVHTMYYVQQLS